MAATAKAPATVSDTLTLSANSQKNTCIIIHVIPFVGGKNVNFKGIMPVQRLQGVLSQAYYTSFLAQCCNASKVTGKIVCPDPFKRLCSTTTALEIKDTLVRQWWMALRTSTLEMCRSGFASKSMGVTMSHWHQWRALASGALAPLKTFSKIAPSAAPPVRRANQTPLSSPSRCINRPNRLAYGSSWMNVLCKPPPLCTVGPLRHPGTTIPHIKNRHLVAAQCPDHLRNQTVVGELRWRRLPVLPLVEGFLQGIKLSRWKELFFFIRRRRLGGSRLLLVQQRLTRRPGKPDPSSLKTRLAFGQRRIEAVHKEALYFFILILKIEPELRQSSQPQLDDLVLNAGWEIELCSQRLKRLFRRGQLPRSAGRHPRPMRIDEGRESWCSIKTAESKTNKMENSHYANEQCSHLAT